MSKILKINKVAKEYFEHNPSVKIIPAKDEMPYFILAGIFPKDTKNGLPIRKVLRGLDEKNELHQIPYVYAERKAVNTNWFFQRNGSSSPSPKIPVVKPQVKVLQKTGTRKDSDEYYVLDLCDEVLGRNGFRQHKFEFLVGDTGRKLPVDIYYADLNLVVEYSEYQHTNVVKFFDKPDKLTASGVSRGEQRKIYDQRRREMLPKHGITLVELDYSDFECNRNNKIVRDRKLDLNLIRQRLIEYV